MSEACEICCGNGRIAVGWSPAPAITDRIRIEYEPCPECQSGPHSGYALRKAKEIKDCRKWTVTFRAPTLKEAREALRMWRADNPDRDITQFSVTLATSGDDGYIIEAIWRIKE